MEVGPVHVVDVDTVWVRGVRRPANVRAALAVLCSALAMACLPSAHAHKTKSNRWIDRGDASTTLPESKAGQGGFDLIIVSCVLVFDLSGLRSLLNKKDGANARPRLTFALVGGFDADSCAQLFGPNAGPCPIGVTP